MTEPTVTVEGLNTLVRTLRRAGEDIAELKEAHAAVGSMVAAAAAQRAPRRSGNLAGSVRPAKRANGARVMAGRASVPYAGPIHWGWPARHITAQPFVSEAARATESRWVARYTHDVQAALDHVRGA
jgi:hypothetical protein